MLFRCDPLERQKTRLWKEFPVLLVNSEDRSLDEAGEDNKRVDDTTLARCELPAGLGRREPQDTGCNNKCELSEAEEAD